MSGVELAITSAVVSGASSMMQASAQSKASQANAAVADQEARAARQAADFEETRQRERGRSLLSSQRAAIGKSGLTAEGSALLARTDSASELEMDALAIRYSGSVEEMRAKSQAAKDRTRAATARIGGAVGVGKSLLTGASKLNDLRFFD